MLLGLATTTLYYFLPSSSFEGFSDSFTRGLKEKLES